MSENSSSDTEQGWSHYSRIVITVESSVALSVECVVLVVLLGNKAYRSFLQRLFVWIVLGLIAHDSSRMVGIAFHYNATSLEDGLCEGIALTLFWSWWFIYTLLAVMAVFLLAMVCIQTRDTSALILAKLKTSKAWRVLLEAGILLASIALPMTILWVPFYDSHGYGFNGYMCALTVSNHSHHHNKIINRISDIPSDSVGLVAVLALALIVFHCILSPRLKHHKHARRVLRNLIVAYLVIIAFTVIDIVSGEILGKVTAVYFLAALCMQLLFKNLKKVALLVGYLLLFHFSEVCAPLRRLAKRRRKESCHAQNSKYRTFTEPHRTATPSSTYFDILYTGEFTSVISLPPTEKAVPSQLPSL